jgi:hypothetical protein
MVEIELDLKMLTAVGNCVGIVASCSKALLLIGFC